MEASVEDMILNLNQIYLKLFEKSILEAID